MIPKYECKHGIKGYKNVSVAQNNFQVPKLDKYLIVRTELLLKKKSFLLFIEVFHRIIETLLEMEENFEW